MIVPDQYSDAIAIEPILRSVNGQRDIHLSLLPKCRLNPALLRSWNLAIYPCKYAVIAAVLINIIQNDYHLE
jgi:hypothetical protein